MGRVPISENHPKIIFLVRFVTVISIAFFITSGVVNPDTETLSDRALDHKQGDGITYSFPVYYSPTSTVHYSVKQSLDYTLTEKGFRDSMNAAIDRHYVVYWGTIRNLMDHMPGSSLDLVDAIAEKLESDIDLYSGGKGYTDFQRSMVVAEFVWSTVDYMLDIDLYGFHEWWATPYEVLYLGYGDCEDSSVLYNMIADRMGLDVVSIIYPTHVVCGVALNKNDRNTFTYNDKTYSIVETTGSQGYRLTGIYWTEEGFEEWRKKMDSHQYISVQA